MFQVTPVYTILLFFYCLACVCLQPRMAKIRILRSLILYSFFLLCLVRKHNDWLFSRRRGHHTTFFFSHAIFTCRVLTRSSIIKNKLIKWHIITRHNFTQESKNHCILLGKSTFILTRCNLLQSKTKNVKRLPW